MSRKKQIKKYFLWSLGLFVLLFLFRISYGFFSYPAGIELDNIEVNSNWDRSSNFKNIASSKYEYKKSAAQTQVVQVDQKFEKTANLACKTNKFEEDEKTIRATIKSQSAIIQFQQKSGNKGNQRLSMQIGVPPLAFDSFLEEIKKSQKVVSISLTKKDKTNEYRELNSKLNTLTKTRNSLSELKGRGGKIEEYIQLENRILEIDEQLQGLGVLLGNFDSENEFCTVNLSLKEGKIKQISLFQRVKVALEWTIKYYLMMMIGLLFALGGAFFLVLIIDKLNIFTKPK